MNLFKNTRLYFLMAACLLAIMPVNAFADMSWEETVELSLTVGDQTRDMRAVEINVSIHQNVLMVQDKTQRKLSYINMTTRDCVILNLANRAFVTTDLNKIRSENANNLFKQYNAAQRRKEQLEQSDATHNNPTEQVVLLEAQILQYNYSRAQLEVKLSGEVETIEGHECKKYVVLAGPDTFAEIWVAQDVQPDQWYKQYTGAAASLDPVTKRVLNKLPGFPIKSIFIFGPLRQVVTVRHFTTAEIPLSNMLLPEDAQPQDLD